LQLTRKYHSPVYSELRTPAKNAFSSLEQADTVEQVRGIEGGFASVYFRYFPGMLINAMGFKKRTRRPPKDPVNAMLSFGYTLLFLNIFSLLEAKGLDPYLGFLHDIRYSHPALASDLIEPFRFMVDKTVIDLINQEQIRPSHFENKDGVTMTGEGVKIFTVKLRENLHSHTTWENGEKQSVIRQLENTIVKLVRYMGKKEQEFKISDWK
jgi:CRISPR-associated protein Cas1